MKYQITPFDEKMFVLETHFAKVFNEYDIYFSRIRLNGKWG